LPPAFEGEGTEQGEDERVTLWNPYERRKLAGAAAPMAKNLQRYMDNNEGWELYDGQDGGVSLSPKASPTSRRKRGADGGVDSEAVKVKVSRLELPKLASVELPPQRYVAEFGGRSLGSFSTPDQASAAFAHELHTQYPSARPGRIRGNPRFTRESDVARAASAACTADLDDQLPSDLDPKVAQKIARTREWLPRGWTVHYSPREGQSGNTELTFRHPICHQHFESRREVEAFLDSGYSELPDAEPVATAENADHAWTPKPDPFLEIHQAVGAPLERGFKTYRRIAVLRPLGQPDANDLLEAYYFHAPQKFKAWPNAMPVTAPVDDPLKEGTPAFKGAQIPIPYEEQLIADAGGESAWQRCQYANAEWRRTAKLRADLREQRELEKTNAYQPHGLAADSWNR